MSQLVGINLIGFASGNLGLGVVAREFARLLLDRGHPLAIFDLDAGEGRSGTDLSLKAHFVDRLEDLPHAINLWVVAAPQSGDMAAMLCASADLQTKLNTIFLWWELPDVPKAWLLDVGAFDVVVTGSEFVRESWANLLSQIPVLLARHPLSMPADIRADRTRFALPRDALLFYFGFEAASDPSRKNPFAAVQAFQQAFPDRNDTRLVIKINNPDGGDARSQAQLKRLDSLIGDDPRVICLRERYAYRELLSLYASCDVMVSLHRAEGLGLMPLEAMRLGKPVIATGWSGNMTYMNHASAALVRYDLVPIDANSSHYSLSEIGIQSRWAEPDVAHAAAWMRALAENPELRDSMGKRAMRAALEYNQSAGRAEFLDELAVLSSQRSMLIPKDYAAMLRRLQTIKRQRQYRRLGVMERSLAQLRDGLHANLERHILWRFRSGSS